MDRDCPWCGLPVEVDWRAVLRRPEGRMNVVLYRCLRGDHRWPEVRD